ncbi:hypothetical protein [Saccharothrix deserti]|nr:hypothetical protein [Saccharothrix deserti]
MSEADDVVPEDEVKTARFLADVTVTCPAGAALHLMADRPAQALLARA